MTLAKKTLALIAFVQIVAGNSASQANPPTPDFVNWQGPCFNCYNYATNNRGPLINPAYFAQPGGGVGVINCAAVIAAAAADGLVFLGNPAPGAPVPAPPAGQCVVGLAVSPGFDYHWYRLNADGTWSHKPGQTPAIPFPGGGLPPHSAPAARGIYGAFCGYFAVNPAAPPALAPGSPSWLRLGFGFRAYVRSFTGLLDPLFDFFDVGLLDEHTPADGPVEPVEFPDITQPTVDGGVAVLLDLDAELETMPGVRYLHAFEAEGVPYVAAYYSIEDPVEYEFFIDDRGLGDYIRSLTEVPTLEADFDKDGDVDGDDFLIWQLNFGNPDATHNDGDADGDGDVDGEDFLIWQRQFGGGFEVGGIASGAAQVLGFKHPAARTTWKSAGRAAQWLTTGSLNQNRQR